MVCRDADEKAKDPSAKTSGGNVAKMYGAAAGNGVLENRRQPQEEDASVEGSAKRRRAEAAACSVMHVQAPGMQQAEVTGAKKTFEKLEALPLQARCRFLSGHVSWVAATRMYRNHRVRRWQAYADTAGWSWIAVRMDERTINARCDGGRSDASSFRCTPPES